MLHAYLFETRGIQRFLFSSGRLRDMLGGSELLDYLCADGGLLDQTLQQLDLTPRVARKAGGAFYLLFTDRAQAERLRATWRLACARWIPGVEQVDALASAETAREAITKGLEILREARNRMTADLPRPGPLSERSARTGLAAVKRDRKESLDAPTARQRSFKRPTDAAALSQRFLDQDGLIWPVNFEESAPASERFPLGERRLVGLLHADGNGLGELLRVLNEACRNANDDTYIQLYRTFSEGLGRATLQAAREASRKVLVPAAQDQVLPARPLVLGGDDLTILLRADLALDFTRCFLDAFETASKEAMHELHRAFQEAKLDPKALPQYLTACAGLCFMKCTQPFHAGHELAESLCKRAKGASRKVRQAEAPMPATLAFHKVQDSIIEDAESQFRQNHVATHRPARDPHRDTAPADASNVEQREIHLALPAYALRPTPGLPALDDLDALLTIFTQTRGEGRINDRPLREIATLMYSNLPLARQAYTRWRDLAGRENHRALQRFDKALHALVGATAPDLPCSLTRDTDPGSAAAHTPLSDLLALLTVQATPRTAAEACPQ